MPDIVLATLNAKYAHSAFGLRYLLANLGPLKDRAEILEFEASRQTLDILGEILEREPRIVGLGVYIWNVEPMTRLVADLKRLRPDLTIILGGPEVSYEPEDQEIVRLADFVLTGEADRALSGLCEQILAGGPLPEKIIPAGLPVLDSVVLPYDLYTDEDVRQRVIYVEASRGCPFTCEFCLSALEIPVRQFALEGFLAAMDSLLQRGVQQFKFVDRTFNLNLKVSRAILQFFLDRMRPGLFLHFEMIPDRLPESLRELIAKFPPGALQFEVGIQTFNEEVGERIRRRQDNAQVETNLRWLRDHTGVHVHADLIVGLPGEDLASFGRGFDRLVRLHPQEIQVGLLKRLRGTPIIRHDVECGMIYSPHPPYEILQTASLDFAAIQRLRRFARFWDLTANSGNFVETTPHLWGDESPFEWFLRFSDWLHAEEGRKHGIPLVRLAELLFNFLTRERSLSPETVAAALLSDFNRLGRSDRPPFLRPFATQQPRPSRAETSLPARQARHVMAPPAPTG